MIKSILNEKSIILFWDVATGYEKGNKYLIYLNDKLVGETEKTHFTAKDLLPDTEYGFRVVLCGERESLVGEESLKTEKEKKRINVADAPYFAKGDGKTLNTKAIQKAIDDCGKGECVYIPKGDFMTGSLFLHSDMELYIEEGAILHGTADVKDYSPKIKSRFEGIEMMCYSALLNMGELNRNGGYNCKNVKICGGGTVCGGGRELAENVIEVEKVLLKDYMESLGDKILECENMETIPGRPRPRLINMSNAQNIVIENITVQNGACWNVHMIYSDNIVTCGCTFRSEKVWNGDGWDPDSSTNCTLFNCHFYTGDDAVAIKSGKNPEGNIVNKPCEHIRVFDCISHFGHGITIGSEMSGGVNDVKIWDCDMGTSVYGVEIKGTKKRGGYVKNVHVLNCKVCRILMHSVGYNDDGEAAPTIPQFKNCTFENIQISAVAHDKDGSRVPCDAIELSGFDEKENYIENVKFKNIAISENEETHKQTISLSFCKGVTFENIYCGELE